MRPRPDAAENRRRRLMRLLAAAGASMRPRPDAAENRGRAGDPLHPRPGFNEAAARCRGKPRPGPWAPERRRRFNEAAARCRGKPAIPASRVFGRGAASMRPRPDAAENHGRDVLLRRAVDASMRPRPDAAENRRRAAAAWRSDPRFNEAAARCRGKPWYRRLSRAAGGAASMRPRPDAAENLTSPPPRQSITVVLQ